MFIPWAAGVMPPRLSWCCRWDPLARFIPKQQPRKNRGPEVGTPPHTHTHIHTHTPPPPGLGTGS